MADNGGIPDWVTYPDEEWQTISPAKAGLDPLGFQQFLDANPVRAGAWEGEEHADNRWGGALARGGYLVHTWGDPDYAFQTASCGKAFTWAALGLAVGAGLLDPDEPIHKTWTGKGHLSHPHKYLNAGHHRTLTWRHLVGFGKDTYEHLGGFPVTNGYYWRRGSAEYSADTAAKNIPEWAAWTGDPAYDNYAHVEPGTQGCYSSGGFWRLSQALTAVWGRDLKEVLDDLLFAEMDIPADRWDWVPGRVVHETRDWYPDMPGYGDFLDPPYEIDGHPVRGGGGWAVMSAKDLARFGLLVATEGMWRGRRLIPAEWIRGHRGGNGSEVAGESRQYTSFGLVTAQGRPYPVPGDLFRGPATGPAKGESCRPT